jgi:hypothetical protein
MVGDTMVEWGFNKKRLDEPRIGGAEQYAISRKVHNFVREAIQNSWDQRLSESDPVKVSFTFVELEGEELDDFLNDVKWTEGLKEHLEACSTQNNHDKPKLRRNLVKFNEGKMRILQVSDSNTKGLSGPEFGDQGNFSKLCRNKMTPSEGGGSAARGGAFGVGKSVYWSFSGLNTVVFSSIYTDEHGVEKSRVFGRTYLPDHQITDASGDSSIFSGDAYLCIRDSDDQRVSMDFAAAGLASSSLLNRQPGDFGTSITLLMYEEVESEDKASLADTAAKYRDAIIANFWPLLASQQFEATVEWKSRGGSGSELVGIPEEFDPFVRALKQSQSDDAIKEKSEPNLLDPGATAFFSGDIKVPTRKDEEYPRDAVPEGQVAVCVTRLTEDEKQKLAQFEERYKDMKFLNRLANVRGPHMVVANHEYVSGACFDHVGVVRAGRFRDLDGQSSENDEGIEQFLRDSEPPAHDSWQFSDKIRNMYKPYGIVVPNMYADISSKARRILRAVLKGDKDRPDGLASLLVGQPTSADIVPPPLKGFQYRSTMKCTFDLSKRVARCIVTVKRVGNAKAVRTAWQATVGIEGVGEQGDSTLHHLAASVREEFPVNPNGTAMNVKSYTVTAPAEADEFEIELLVSLATLSDAIIKRLRLTHKLDAKASK